jgi:hypothetical protein
MAASGTVNVPSLGATLGATRMNDFEEIRTRVYNEQGNGRGHELI